MGGPRGGGLLPLLLWVYSRSNVSLPLTPCAAAHTRPSSPCCRMHVLLQTPTPRATRGGSNRQQKNTKPFGDIALDACHTLWH